MVHRPNRNPRRQHTRVSPSLAWRSHRSGLVFTPDEVLESYLDDPEIGGGAKQRRKIEILRKDSVHTISLPELVKQIIAVVQKNVGGDEAFRELCRQRVDEVLLEQMNTLLS